MKFIITKVFSFNLLFCLCILLVNRLVWFTKDKNYAAVDLLPVD